MPASTAYALGDLLAVTRSSKRWVFDGAGALVELANNTAGLTYDPATLAPLGLFTENSGSNAIRNPRGEGSTGGTLGEGGILPTHWLSGGSAAPITRRVVGSGTESGIPYVDVEFSSAGVSSGATTDIYFDAASAFPILTGDFATASVFLRIVSGAPPASQQICLLEYDSAGTYLRTNAGVVALTGLPLARQRCVFTASMQHASCAFARMLLRFTPNFGDAFNVVVRIGLPQLEKETSASSPILPPATTPSAASRLADIPTLDLSKVGFANMGSTIIWGGRCNSLPPASNTSISRGLWRIDDGGNTNYIAAYVNWLGNLRLRWSIDGAYIDTLVGSIVEGAEFVARFSWGPGVCLASLNGAASVVNATAGYPVGLNRCRLGMWGQTAGNALYGTIRQFDIIPRTATAAELPTLSA